jgi:hypothetical protein
MSAAALGIQRRRIVPHQCRNVLKNRFPDSGL